MERKLLNDILRRLTETLTRVPGVTVRKRIRERGLDLLLEVRHDGSKQTVVVEAKRSGAPGIIQSAAQQLRKHATTSRASYAVFGAPYLTPRSIEACRNEGIGCIDTAGNCLLSFGSLYIEIQGNPNPSPTHRDIKSLFSPKSSRVARALLSDVGRWWGVREIATETEINPGLVSRLKGRLVAEGLAQENQGKIMADPSLLLKAWSENYSYRRNEILEFYTLDTPVDAERKLVEYCRSIDVRCALGLFSGATRIAPHVRMNKAFIFVDDDPEEIATGLGWKAVSSGANVMLLQPYDAGVFLFSQEADGFPIVSDIQLYLDLKNYKGRGDEAAEFLFRTTIQPQWQREANTSPKK